MIENLGILKSKQLDGENNTYLESTINHSELDEFILARMNMLDMLSKRVEINQARSGSATFAKIDAYAPVIPSGVSFALEFDSEIRPSNDAKLYLHPNLKAFKVGLEGTYSINVYWYVNIPAPEAMTYVELQLYKNGVFECVLGGEPIAAYATLGSNAFHKAAYLQGSKVIELTQTDRFDIRLKHDKTAGFGASESHGGYIDITLLKQRSQ